MNVVTIIGNLTKDPELRSRDTMSICRFTVAVNDRKKNQQTGEWEDNTSYIPVVVFGRQADNCDRFLSKGRKVAVNGRIQTGSYTKQDGTKVYTTDVIANNVEFLNAQDSGNWPPKEQRETNRGYAERERAIPDGFEAFAAKEEVPF